VASKSAALILVQGVVHHVMTDEETRVREEPGVSTVDLLIVGAGPVGLFGAYYAGVRGLRVGVVDSLNQVGGQITAMYPEKQIYDVAGFSSVSGRDLVAALERQAAQHHPRYLLGQDAQQLRREPRESGVDQLVVTTSLGTAITCRAIIVTGGIGMFTPRPLPAGEGFLGRGLEYFVPRPQEYAGQEVVVVGGGDSAVDWVLMLEPIASRVTLVHRRDAFRAHPANVAKMRETSAQIITNAQVTVLEGGDRVEKAVVTGKDGSSRVVPCQRVVAALGFTANLGPLRDWGIELRQNRHVVVDSAMRTNVPGLFAAGDIVEYDGKVKLIATGFGEVATAANNAAVYIDPSAHIFPGHSTDLPERFAAPH
jgi:ferredoxin/flavodoxin---NADP+ reductase